MFRHTIFFICLFALASGAFAEEPQLLVKEGNELYTKNKFDEAIVKYKSVLNAGFSSSELYFNLGNACFKTHDIKSAILYFEKAKLLNPGDKDIDYNLELARSFTVDKIEAMPDLFLMTWEKWIRNQMSANGWAVLSILTFLFALVCLLAYLLSGVMLLKKTGFWLGTVTLVIAIVSFTMSYQLKRNQTAQDTAIVFTATITVKSSPAQSGNNLFVIHEGAKVEILDQVGEWREIRIADGNRGWVKVSDITTI
jgi:tetratricopeptide (TPR) repeat protein